MRRKQKCHTQHKEQKLKEKHGKKKIENRNMVKFEIKEKKIKQNKRKIK